MRIAIVTESFPPVFNGVANSVVRVLESIREQGHDAIVIAPTTPGKEFMGFKTYQVPSVPIFQFQLGMPSPLVAKLLSEYAPDVIHVASPVLLGSQAINWAERNNVPCVAIFQTDLAAYAERYGFKVLRPMMDKFMANIHAPATLNLAPTAEVKKYLNRLGINNVEIWGRGVDLELYNPNRKLLKEVHDLRQKLAPNGETIVGYVGRLAAEKSVERFVELIDVPNTAFVIVGDGPERASLESKLGKKNVHFVGKQSGEDLANYYAAMDVFVHYGQEETFGQTIQEAQAAGAVVIAPEAGGPKFLIESGVSGYLMNPKKVGVYKEQLLEVMADSELRARIGEGGRRSVLNKSWKENNNRLFELYLTAIRQSTTEELEQLQIA